MFYLSFYFIVCMEMEGLATKQYGIRRLHCMEIEGSNHRWAWGRQMGGESGDFGPGLGEENSST